MRRMRSIVQTSRWPALGLALFLGCDGAEDELPRQAVTGKVTLGGQALEQGQISFVPASAEVGTQVGGAIVAGAYSLERATGPVPGTYLVRIQGGFRRGRPRRPGQEVRRAARPRPCPLQHHNHPQGRDQGRRPEQLRLRTAVQVTARDREPSSNSLQRIPVPWPRCDEASPSSSSW